jgi:hypothetical protein
VLTEVEVQEWDRGITPFLKAKENFSIIHLLALGLNLLGQVVG